MISVSQLCTLGTSSTACSSSAFQLPVCFCKNIASQCPYMCVCVCMTETHAGYTVCSVRPLTVSHVSAFSDCREAAFTSGLTESRWLGRAQSFLASPLKSAKCQHAGMSSFVLSCLFKKCDIFANSNCYTATGQCIIVFNNLPLVSFVSLSRFGKLGWKHSA